MSSILDPNSMQTAKFTQITCKTNEASFRIIDDTFEILHIFDSCYSRIIYIQSSKKMRVHTKYKKRVVKKLTNFVTARFLPYVSSIYSSWSR